jgi:hypothetical protein
MAENIGVQDADASERRIVKDSRILRGRRPEIGGTGR